MHTIYELSESIQKEKCYEHSGHDQMKIADEIAGNLECSTEFPVETEWTIQASENPKQNFSVFINFTLKDIDDNNYLTSLELILSIDTNGLQEEVRDVSRILPYSWSFHESFGCFKLFVPK